MSWSWAQFGNKPVRLLLKPYAQRPGRSVSYPQDVRLGALGHRLWLPEESDPTEPRNSLREQLQPLAG